MYPKNEALDITCQKFNKSAKESIQTTHACMIKTMAPILLFIPFISNRKPH